MSSEHLASAQNLLKGNLAGAWGILSGAQGLSGQIDVGIARRFGGASAAYSLRDIGANGSRIVRVRRDTGGGAGDDDEEDFSANQINSGALESFVGAGNNGFVVTWYDQSGNGNDATTDADTNEPRIVISGSLINNEAGKPTIDFVPSSDFFNVPIALDNINTASVFCVWDRDVNSGNGAIAGQLGISGTTSRMYTPLFVSSNMYWGYGTSSTAINLGTYNANQTYLTSFVTGDTNAEAFLDNVSKGTTAIQSAVIDAANGSIGRHNRGSTAFPLNGKVSEVIYYKNKLQADVSEINTEINNYYGIYS